MFNLFKSKKEKWINPIKGEIIPIEQVPDDVFAGKMMGDGFGVIPEDNEVYSPVSGEIIKVFKTKHALLIKCDSGLEIILHIGIGTVELKGEGFTIHVEQGARIEPGTHLATVDFDYIASMDKSTVTPIVITNMDQVKKLDVTYGKHEVKEEVCEITGV